ncbi:cofactor-independent phosphoglycerate mutase [Methanosphaerula palustris]|uniref:phosphoglycerate mutase (2,3-diphosphoglycerate-independent) n=1 Tax=Methanosphaerula palustris (strain ATCC BAA-1556 / DSM 19958 / E1-9c) TaxID=521011 RepID=B8GDG9_METPE|nr:cofactor-independent phosphoglycerate mutase [Methanosphaerula palustris]ACL17320.1 proposed homoserine kinase [Methanosphaerula palustris E1-9c]
MKYLLVLGDGMADEPIPELGNRTPLAYANTPNMDRIAREGRSGQVQTVPDGFEPGSDVANLSILGYHPARFYTGRGPLEAVNMGVDLTDDQIAYRCNLVTIRDGVMQDFSAGHITSAEGAALFKSLQEYLPEVKLVSGVSYRNLLVVDRGRGAEGKAPHDIVGEEIEQYLPHGEDAPLLRACIEKSIEVFADHPVNRDRLARGLPAATMIWPWSGGKRPALIPFQEKYGKKGGMISAVDLLNGIARYADMKVITVPGATGYLDTDYQAKARYAIEALKDLDFLYLHVEAPDEAGHLGSLKEKVKAIERVDEMIGTIMAGFDGVIAVLPDHATPIRLKTHTRGPVPCAVLGKGKDETEVFSEEAAANGSLGMIRGDLFLTELFS